MLDSQYWEEPDCAVLDVVSAGEATGTAPAGEVAKFVNASSRKRAIAAAVVKTTMMRMKLKERRVSRLEKVIFRDR